MLIALPIGVRLDLHKFSSLTTNPSRHFFMARLKTGEPDKHFIHRMVTPFGHRACLPSMSIMPRMVATNFPGFVFAARRTGVATCDFSPITGACVVLEAGKVFQVALSFCGVCPPNRNPPFAGIILGD